MKLAWSPDSASKAYLDTVKSCQIFGESGAAELVAAMAAGWNAQFIVETWFEGGAISMSVGLATARSHTGGRHVCVVPDERLASDFAKSLSDVCVSLPEIVVGEAEEVMNGLVGVDFLVVDCRRKDFSRVFRLAKLSGKGGFWCARTRIQDRLRDLGGGAWLTRNRPGAWFGRCFFRCGRDLTLHMYPPPPEVIPA